MNKTISIVITQHSETEKDILPCLTSIDSQICADFSKIEVIIVNDGSRVKLAKGFLQSFRNIKPKYSIRKKSGGIGQARQTGIDLAKNEYVYFMDAADSFFAADSVYTIANSLEGQEGSPPIDLLSTHRAEELEDKTCIVNGYNIAWAAGKAYRLDFLKDHSIRFSDDKRIVNAFDDYYFNFLAVHCQAQITHIEAICYIWRYSAQPIARRPFEPISYESLAVYAYAIHKAMKDNQPSQYSVTQLLLYCYFNVCRQDWLEPDKKQFRDAVLKEMADLLVDFNAHLLPFGSFSFNSLYASEAQRLEASGEYLEKEYVEFLGEIKSAGRSSDGAEIG